MMVRWEEGGGVHISKSQTNEREYYPITDTNLGNGCGRNFLFVIIRFAPVNDNHTKSAISIHIYSIKRQNISMIWSRPLTADQ